MPSFMLGACEDLETSASNVYQSILALTFPQPGNSQAWTRLPFLALLILPVGVEVGWTCSKVMLAFLILPELALRDVADEGPALND